jgi:sulfonate transport system substrate-binding protein
MARYRSIFRRALVVVASVALAACHRSGDGRTEIVLGDQAGLAHAKADAAGVFRDTPYAVRWANFPGAAPLFEAMNAGAVDTAPAGDAPFILAGAGHVPLRIVAISRSSARGVGILVPKDSPIRSVADLRGRHVIVSSARGSVSQYLLLEALRRAKVAPADLTIGFLLPNDAASAFEAGKIDAWATFGSYQAIAEARGARVLIDGRGINSGIGVLAVSEAALGDPSKRAAMADYVRRQARVNLWTRTHPDAYAAIYAQRTGVPIGVARTIVSWENPVLQPVDAKAVHDLQDVADRFLGFGVIPERVNIAPLVDATLFTGESRTPASARN